MKRLTQKDEQGNWCLKGLAWAQLYVGQMITMEVNEKLYGALWKLMKYEDTGLTPDEITELKEMREPKKALWENGFYGGYACPACGEVFTVKRDSYCPCCGQSIDWETEDLEEEKRT